jgi:hypothetical protein
VGNHRPPSGLVHETPAMNMLLSSAFLDVPPPPCVE